MSALTRTVVVAEMQARELLRRRAVMVLLVLLPVAFYYSAPADQTWAVLAAVMGVSWAVAAAALFGILGWRGADPRLGLAGAPVYQGLAGRLVLLHVLGLVLVGLFAPLILARSDRMIHDGGALLVALVLMAVVSVAIGLAIGALVPRELEGTLVLIGVVGVGMSVPPDSAVAQSLPTWGPTDAVLIAVGASDGTLATAATHTVLSTLVLLAVAFLAWRRRSRIHPPQPFTP